MERTESGRLTGVVARGTVVNAAAALLAGGLFAARNIIAAAFMGPTGLAVWAVAGVVLLTALSLRGVGVVERFVADRDRPAREAFNDAFSVGLLFSLAVGLIVAAAAPLLTVAYDDPRLLSPLLAVAALVVVDGLKFPVWWHYRELRYGTQRAIMLTDAVGSVLFALPLLALGWDYWALVAGAAIASVFTVALAWGIGPRPAARRPTRETIRRYAAFSGPVLTFALVGVITGHIGYITIRHSVGIHALGWIAVAVIPFMAAERLSSVLNQSVYPALVRRGDAARERAAETMQTIAWAVTAPLMLGVAATAPWLIPLGLGPAWESAGDLMAAFALVTVIHQFGFPFQVLIMSTGRTGAIGRFAVLFVAGMLLIVIPATLLFGLAGYAAGAIVLELLLCVERWRIVHQILPGANLFRDIGEDLLVAALPGLGAGAGLLATTGSGWSFRLPVAAALTLPGILVLILRHWPLAMTMLDDLRRTAPAPDPSEQPAVLAPAETATVG